MERLGYEFFHRPCPEVARELVGKVLVHGEKQLQGCTTQRGIYLPCKTLLIAVGLRPERELVSHLGTGQWLHLCGNCNKVHPMVEAVVQEGKQAGIAAAENLRGGL